MKYIFLTLCILLASQGYAQENPKDTAATEKTKDVYVEEIPKPTFELNKYLSKNIKYPKSAEKRGIQGRVVVKFVVDENGDVTECTIAKGFDKECDAEALRVVQNMPPWKPGTQNGKPVKVYYNLPINFNLGNNSSGQPKWKKKKD